MRLPDILTRAIVNLHDADERLDRLAETGDAGFESAYHDMQAAANTVVNAARLCAPAIVAARDEAERRRRDTIAEDHADEAAEMRRTA